MSGSIFKRCGCRAPITDQAGAPVLDKAGKPTLRQLGNSCPELSRPGGGWSTTHGTWRFQLEVNTGSLGPRVHVRSGGYRTRKDAERTQDGVVELLAIAERADDPDDARVLIAKMAQAALKARVPLPDADEVRKRVRAGRPVEVSTTVAEWLTDWLKAKKPVLRPTTHLLYTSHVNTYLIPLLGHHRLDKLRAAHVRNAMEQIAETAEVIAAENAARHAVAAAAKKAWRDHNATAARSARAKLAEMPPFRRPVQAASIQRIRAALRSALSDAVNEQLIDVNPAKLVKLPSGKRPKPLMWTDARVAAWRATGEKPASVMVWTAPQTQAFLARAARHRLFALYLTIAYCGLRRGEACGLRWQDVDFKGRMLTIAQQIVQLGWDTDIGDTKTDAGERTVAIPTSVHLALNDRRLATDREQLDCGPTWTDTGLVFTNRDGTPLHPALITDLFNALVREARLPPIRLHDLRHGTATHALTAGVAMKVVSEMLGHSNIAITMDTYTAVVDEAKRSAAQAIAEQFDA